MEKVIALIKCPDGGRFRVIIYIDKGRYYLDSLGANTSNFSFRLHNTGDTVIIEGYPKHNGKYCRYMLAAGKEVLIPIND